MNGTRFVRWNLIRPAFGLERERVAERRGAVDLGGVVAGAAVDRVASRRRCSRPACRCRRRRSSCRRPSPPTRRSLPSPPSSASPVSAPVSTSSPTSPLSVAAAISRVLREHRHRVVAVAAVDDDGERAVGRDRLVAGRGAVPVRAAVEPAGRLAVHEQAAGHRHRHVVVGAVEVERRHRPYDRRRAHRRVRGGSRCGEACGQRCSERGQDGWSSSCRLPPSGNEFVVDSDAQRPGPGFAPWRPPGLSESVMPPPYGAMLWLRWKTLSGSYRRFDLAEPVVVRAVGRADGVVRLVVAEVVEPAAGAEMRPQRRERLAASTRCSPRVSAGSDPDGRDQEVPALARGAARRSRSRRRA